MWNACVRHSRGGECGEFFSLENISTGCLKNRGPFLKMLLLLYLWRKLFQIFCGSSLLILLCINMFYCQVALRTGNDVIML